MVVDMQKIVFGALNVCLLALAAVQVQAAIAANDEDVAITLAEKIEPFYGKNIKEVDKFLAENYGVAKPMKKEGSAYTYMVPVSDPICGSVKLDTSNHKITGVQTMSWNRGDDNLYGNACDLAFKHTK